MVIQDYFSLVILLFIQSSVARNGARTGEASERAAVEQLSAA